MRIPIAQLVVIVAVVVASPAAALPSLAQPSPAANRTYLPAISTPLLVEITDAAFFSGGKVPGFGVQGHVRNNGATPVYAVTLHADFVDLQGQLVASRTFAAALPAIFPGETIPFRIKVFWPLNLEPYQHSHYDLTVLRFERSSTVTYVPVTIVSTQIQRDAERGVVYRVAGYSGSHNLHSALARVQ